MVDLFTGDAKYYSASLLPRSRFGAVKEKRENEGEERDPAPVDW